jgi:hypothetical protein
MKLKHHAIIGILSALAALSAMGCATETSTDTGSDDDEALPTEAQIAASPEDDADDAVEVAAAEPAGAPMAEAEDGADVVENERDTPRAAEAAGLGTQQLQTLGLDDWDRGPVKCKKIPLRFRPDPNVCVQAFVKASDSHVDARGYLWTTGKGFSLRSGTLHVWLMDPKGSITTNNCKPGHIEDTKPSDRTTGFPPYYCSVSSKRRGLLRGVTYAKFDVRGDGKGSYYTPTSATGFVQR